MGSVYTEDQVLDTVYSAVSQVLSWEQYIKTTSTTMKNLHMKIKHFHWYVLPGQH